MKITQPTSLDNPISMITIIVDGTALDVPAGINLLQACLDNGIYIPHLCHCRDRQRPAASCRLCFVEIEGEDAPVAACTIPLKAPITVRTDTSAVRRAGFAGHVVN